MRIPLPVKSGLDERPGVVVLIPMLSQQCAHLLRLDLVEVHASLRIDKGADLLLCDGFAGTRQPIRLSAQGSLRETRRTGDSLTQPPMAVRIRRRLRLRPTHDDGEDDADDGG